MREKLIEKQIQWVLTYIQKESANVQKNLLEKTKTEEVDFALLEYLLTKLKKKFRGGNNNLTKITKLKRIE